ncbi:MAG: hypothetical protein WD627_13330, partial [Actinomycetota bacterium]
RLVRDEEVVGSNPAIPTKKYQILGRPPQEAARGIGSSFTLALAGTGDQLFSVLSKRVFVPIVLV